MIAGGRHPLYVYNQLDKPEYVIRTCMQINDWEHVDCSSQNLRNEWQHDWI
jgi:hypothetical protein